MKVWSVAIIVAAIYLTAVAISVTGAVEAWAM